LGGGEGLWREGAYIDRERRERKTEREREREREEEEEEVEAEVGLLYSTNGGILLYLLDCDPHRLDGGDDGGGGPVCNIADPVDLRARPAAI